VVNLQTAEGRLLHEHADVPGESRRGDLRTIRGMWLRLERLRLTGRADIFEFRPEPNPVEYKRGKSKPNGSDNVQLRAQALCLEKMLKSAIARGAIFYSNPRGQREVIFTPELRARTEKLAAKMHCLYLPGDAGGLAGSYLAIALCITCVFPRPPRSNTAPRAGWRAKCIRSNRRSSSARHAKDARYAACDDSGYLPVTGWGDHCDKDRPETEPACPVHNLEGLVYWGQVAVVRRCWGCAASEV
jgi:CRISPR-associated exonuclease Cas4